MARNYAALMHDYLTEMEDLSDEEFGRLCRALLRYSIDGEPVTGTGNEKWFSKVVMHNEDRVQDSYSRKAGASAENGKKGGRPPKHKDESAKPAEPDELPCEAEAAQVSEENLNNLKNLQVSQVSEENLKNLNAQVNKSKSNKSKEKQSKGDNNPPISPLRGDGDQAPARTHKETQEEMYDRLATVFTPGTISDTLDHEIRLWLRYKTERKQPYKESGLAALLRKIVLDEAVKHGEKKVCDLIEECMASNYSGIIWDKLDKPQGSYAGNRGRPTDIVEQMKDW